MCMNSIVIGFLMCFKLGDLLANDMLITASPHKLLEAATLTFSHSLLPSPSVQVLGKPGLWTVIAQKETAVQPNAMPIAWFIIT